MNMLCLRSSNSLSDYPTVKYIILNVSKSAFLPQGKSAFDQSDLKEIDEIEEQELKTRVKVKEICKE